MTEPPRPDERRGSRARTVLQDTPNAERFVLEADAMRRRQLRSALLHGSRRTWREHARVWPAVVVGIIVAAVVVAALAVTQALQKTEENQRKEEQLRQPTSGPRTPGAGATPSTTPASTPPQSPDTGSAPPSG